MKLRLLGMGLCMLLATAVFGQSRYDVPFAFQVGDQSFAPGHYSISVASLSHGLLISQEGGNATFVYPRNPIQASAPASNGKLVFDCYGKSCFLAQVWRIGSSQGMSLGASKAEREMAKTSTPMETAVLHAARR